LHLLSLARNLQTIEVWDNLNIKQEVRHEDVGHRRSQLDITNASVCIHPEMPEAGLHQSMHNPAVPLSLEDVVFSEGMHGSPIDEEITSSLIADAVRRLHPEAFKVMFASVNASRFPRFPQVEVLQPHKTEFWQYAAVFENEGTIEGTYKVMDDIYLRQRGFQAPDDPASNLPDDFKDRLFLAHGDQLTAHHIRTVKSEQARAERPYDTRNWLIGVPAWFHIQMNLLQTIVRTHFESDVECPGKHHTIMHDVVKWNRSTTTRDGAKYHVLEPVVAQGFTSRVVALFYAAMRRRGLLCTSDTLSASMERMEDVTAAIQLLTVEQFLSLVEEVRKVAFTPAAWDSDRGDVEFRTMCRYLQEAELFMAVRQAVKFGDIGLLRRFVDPLAVFFFGAHQHNYGREMLFYRWHLSQANTPELQRAILATGLVNWKGLPSSFKPIDLHMEHLNGACKIDIKHNQNSTHDAQTTFKRVCLCSTWLRSLRQKLEGEFGQDMPDAHTSKVAIPDMFLLARTLLVDDLAEPRSTQQLHDYAMFDSVDIRAAGLSMLEEKIAQFNQQHVKTPGQLRFVPLEPPDGEEISGFHDITTYAELVTDDLFGTLDPTIAVDVETLDLTSLDS
jgi:hypothetical protein